MTKVLWLLEKDTFNEGNPERMAQIAKGTGHDVEWYQYIPFASDLTMHQAAYHQPTVIYGSLNAIRLLNNQPIYPGVWANFDKLRCASYYPVLAEHLLQQDYAFLPMSEVVRRKRWVFDTFSDFPSTSVLAMEKTNPQVFIRPDDNMKSFNGGLVSWRAFERWYEQSQLYTDTSKELVVVARPQRIFGESRCVVVDKKVVSCGGYKGCAPARPDRYWEFASKVAESDYQPHRVFTIDIAHLEHEEFKLLEVGSFNAAGLYECPLEPIMKEVSRVAVEEWEELQ